MKTKPLVVLCWIVVALATIHVALNVVSQVTRPWFGLDYSRESGRVRDVARGGPAERAGIEVGDTIVSVNGERVAAGAVPLYFARAGTPVEATVARNGALTKLSLLPITQEQMRREQLRRGGGAAVLAVNSYLSIPLHLWILAISALLLIKRPANKDARLAAAALASWAGGMFMARTAGFGTLLEGAPYVLHATLLLTDAFFIAGFFAFCLHLALVFPSERGSPRRIEVLPYLFVLPIAIECASEGLRRAAGEVSAPGLLWQDSYSYVGALALFAALATLAVRTLRMREANPRRRLELIFLSLFPGAATFILEFVVSRLNLSYAWEATARLLHTPSVIAGSAIFAYAVVRHRMFQVRFLVRRSLQYALARGTLLVLMTLPAMGFVGFLYAHRRDSLAVLLTGEPALYLLLLVPLVLVVRYRKRLLESVDRRFFREQYDARQLLLQVVSIIRGGSDMLAVSRVALDEIDRALHPRHVALWQRDVGGEMLYRAFAHAETSTPRVESLAVNGTLASLLATTDEPLDVHSRQTRQLLQRLPEGDRAWLRGTDAHLVVPLLIDGQLAGLMLLGERRSEEPYTKEDRDLLRALAAQLALTLDYSRLKHSPSLVWGKVSPPAVIAALNSSEVLKSCPRCGRCYEAGEARCSDDEQQLVVEPGVPRVIEDKYVVSRLLGRGGMGAVYLATQTRLNRPVAIKVLLSHLVGSETMRSRFEREARIVARLRHPAIVTIHDFGLLPSAHAYLVMEHLDGDTLRKLMSKGPLPLETVLPVIARVGEAVDSAHRAGVIHRDLKPENIMVVRGHDAGLSPHVLDFGLARMTAPLEDDEGTLVQTSQSAGGMVGTLMYMAPEILNGHAADRHADQYSLAIITYEMLTGEHPLGRVTDLASVVRGHTEKPMIPIRERVRVPPQVARSIDRALAKQPSARFESVGAFVGELRS